LRLNAVFVARQLLEKGHEHKTPTFFTFVDLKKAYDSVNRDLCWDVLVKNGVPSKIVAMISALHTGMQASIFGMVLFVNHSWSPLACVRAVF